MPRKQRSHPKLRALYLDIIEHEMFDEIRDHNILLVFSSVQLQAKAWADCEEVSIDSFKIRVNASLKLMDVPDYVLAYLVAHELVHILPGCWNHDQKFYEYERELTGENYYDANVWLKRHVALLEREYRYRHKVWLVRQIKDQMRIKDMAAICGCSVSTIKRWLRKFDLEIVYEA